MSDLIDTGQELSEEEVVAVVNADYAAKYGFSDAEDYVFKAEKGLTEEGVRQISMLKGEPEWMLEYRLKAYEHFLQRPMPEWGADLGEIGVSRDLVLDGLEMAEPLPHLVGRGAMVHLGGRRIPYR